MTTAEVLQEMEKLGTEQTRKTYRRHGAGENLYGVKFGDMEKLRKKIKMDHDLAVELWATGNYDARNFALLIADPARTTEKTLNTWVKEVDNYGHAYAIGGYAAKTPYARKLAEKWAYSDKEWIGQSGWTILAHLANGNELPDEYFEPWLIGIGQDIHTRKNRVREAMNSALISIGSRGGHLTEHALATAVKIGKVEVDQGDTNCKTPDAAQYIEKALAHKARKKGAAA